MSDRSDGGAALWSVRGEVPGERTPWIALAALMAVAAVLRAIGLDGGLWLDEIRTLLESVRSPIAQIVTTFPGNNQHTLSGGRACIVPAPGQRSGPPAARPRESEHRVSRWLL